MDHALALAERGRGRVHPNPLVGAVIVRDGAMVGEGWHAEFGQPHAEAVALKQAGPAARGATLYVTLEPCAHHGKQPPCTEAIVAAGIARVVIALNDPNPIAGDGTAVLRRAGITVDGPVRADSAVRQNFRFLHRFSNRSQPYLAIKLAVSMDGQLADALGNSQWIASPESREWVHRLRADFGAIGVGARTAIADDARLTVRGSVQPRTPPARVIFDRSGTLTTTAAVFEDAATIPVFVVVGPAAPASHVNALRAAGALVLVGDGLAHALGVLHQHGIDSILIEGGGRLAAALLQQAVVDRIYQIQCPVWLGHGVPAWPDLGAPLLADVMRYRIVAERRLGDRGDVLIEMVP